MPEHLADALALHEFHDDPVDKILATTRAVRRRLDLDRDVAPDLLVDCCRLAMQAPAGRNIARVRFVVVTDPALREAIATVYRQCFDDYRRSGNYVTDEATPDPGRRAVQARVATSVEHLAAELHRVPVHVLACADGRPDLSGPQAAGYFGSVVPAVWSFMLAARARGLGACWTTMHLSRERQVADLLGIPFDRVAQIALLPVGHTIGTDFRPAPRPDVATRIVWNGWTVADAPVDPAEHWRSDAASEVIAPAVSRRGR